MGFTVANNSAAVGFACEIDCDKYFVDPTIQKHISGAMANQRSRRRLTATTASTGGILPLVVDDNGKYMPAVTATVNEALFPQYVAAAPIQISKSSQTAAGAVVVQQQQQVSPPAAVRLDATAITVAAAVASPQQQTKGAVIGGGGRREGVGLGGSDSLKDTLASSMMPLAIHGAWATMNRTVVDTLIAQYIFPRPQAQPSSATATTAGKQ
jgi:hypothetical protein